MNRRPMSVAMAATLWASALVLAAPASHAGGARNDDVITAGQLATAVEKVNDVGFGLQQVQARRSPASFLPKALRDTDTSDEEAFVASESDHVTDMAEGMAHANDQDAVVDVEVTVDEAVDRGGLRFVTLHVARQLGNGILWEELTPYAVGLAGGPLEVGEIVRVDMEALVSGEVPAELAKRPEVPNLRAGGKARGASDHGAPSEPSGVAPRPEASSPARVPGTARASARRGIGSAGRERAADYAYRYALSPNSSYHEWGNDCTNFISQAMQAGGWSENLGWYQSDGNWWYTGNIGVKASYTWAGAENWYRFARVESGRTSHASYVTSLRRGDVLQYKARGASNMTHTMIVTAKSGSTPYLSYHTSNTRNKPFTAIDHLDVTWFGHFVN